MRRHADLVAVVVLAAAVGAVLLAVGPSAVLGPLALFLFPGYALERALAPSSRLEAPLRTLIALTAGVAALIFGALALDLVSVRLDRTSWTLYALAVTIGASVVAAFRDRRLPARETRYAALARAARRSFSFRPAAVVLFAAAVALTLASLAVARIVLPNTAVRGYTVLSASPKPDWSSVEIRVTSAEQRPMRYRLVARNSNHVVRVWRAISLEPGTSWSARVQRQGTLAKRLSLRLYRTDRPTRVYRRIYLLPVTRAKVG